jgi:hypothetical protein
MAVALGRRIGLSARQGQLRTGDTSPPSPSDRTVPGWAVVSAALQPALLTAGWLVAGALQPASYSPVRETVSVLAGYSGSDRWIMTDAMLLAGGCYLVTAVGMAGLRPAARVLLLVAGLCSVGIAASPEPASGPSALHLAWTTAGAITLAIWPAVAGWRAPPVSARCLIIVTVVFAAMLGWVLVEIQVGSALGLAERTTASVQTCWPLVVALLLRRTRSPGRVPARQLEGAGLQ